MSEAQQTPSIALDACTAIVHAAIGASKAETVAITDATAPAGPNWDAMANSFAALSVSLTIGSLILALITLFGAVGWGYIVKKRAEEEARAEAKSCAKQLIDKWLAEEAPGIIRRKVDMLVDTSLGSENDAMAADEMGEAAG